MLLLLDFEAPFQAVEMGLAHRNIGIGFDFGALFLVAGDDFGQSAHADGVKGVVFIEGRERRLVEADEGDGFEFQAVLGHAGAENAGHFAHESGAAFMQFVHRLCRHNRLNCIDKTALEEVLDLIGIERAGAQGLGGGGDAFDASGRRGDRIPFRCRGAGDLRSSAIFRRCGAPPSAWCAC